MSESLAFQFPSGARKALHVVDTTMFWSATGGGVRRYLTAKDDWLRKVARWPHTIVAPGAGGAAQIDCGGLVLPFSGGYRLPLRRRQAAMLLESLRPDLIEVGDPYRLAWATLDAAQRLGVPAVAFCHSNLAALIERLAGGAGPAPRCARRAAEAYLRRLYRRFDCVLAPSASLVGELQAIGIERAELQALGVDSERFHPRCRDAGLRAALGIAAETRLLLYAGRFAPEKNLPCLVAAAEALGAQYLLLAVGAGPAPPHGARVRVLPHEASEARLARLYASVDVFVHAGDQETFGLAALEAMASGTPIVVRAAGGLAELAAGGAGIAVDSAAPRAWAEALDEVFSARGASRVATARQRAEALDWRRVMPMLAGRYLALAGIRLSSARVA